jgi:hypothetical protein
MSVSRMSVSRMSVSLQRWRRIAVVFGYRKTAPDEVVEDGVWQR